MRHLMCVTAIAATVLSAAPAAQAESLPGLTVPTFSLQFSEYYGVANEAAIGLVSSSAASTVISLDSYAQGLHAEHHGGGSPHEFAEIMSSIRFDAADGYRITGISFSTTASGVLEVPVVDRPDVIEVRYGDSVNHARVHAGITPLGGLQLGPQLDAADQITAPVTLGGTVQNTQGLDAFSFHLALFVSALTETTTVYYSDDPNDPWPQEGKVWGYASIRYANPVLTVYTEAVTAVPEPGQWAMLAGGLLLLAGARRFKRD